MGMFDFLKAKKNTARSPRTGCRSSSPRNARNRGGPDYLPLLQRELLEVISKYVNVDVDAVKVDVVKDGDTTCWISRWRCPRSGRPPARFRAAGAFDSPEFCPTSGELAAEAAPRIPAPCCCCATSPWPMPTPCSPVTAFVLARRRWRADPRQLLGRTGGRGHRPRPRARRYAGAFDAARGRHLIVLSPERRAAVHTDATDSVEEEDATCYLQIVLADTLPGVGSAR